MPVASHELANSIPSRAFWIGRRMQMSARPDLGRETEKDTPLAAQREGSSQPLDTDESTDRQPICSGERNSPPAHAPMSGAQ